jgi:hypothetical protein
VRAGRTAWICVVWATRRCSESYRLVWAVTVVRPRCSGTATAWSVPLLTGRNIWVVEVIVAVPAPSGSPRNVTSVTGAACRGDGSPAAAAGMHSERREAQRL